jgi:hypothetical protein
MDAFPRIIFYVCLLQCHSDMPHSLFSGSSMSLAPISIYIAEWLIHGTKGQNPFIR